MEIETTRFETDIFTTLLHNSIKHGFKGTDRKYIFTIEAYRVNDLIFFEIHDNGEPSELDEYLNESKDESGLKIIKRKIEMTVMPKAINYPPFIIEPIKNRGTTIKFIFPYETIENINS